MGESKIEWTDRSDWNPVRGCTRVSPGCGGPGPNGGCYAEALAARFSLSAAEVEARWRSDAENAGKEPPVFKDQWGHGFAEMQDGKPRWTGKVELQEDRLTLPLSWRKPAKIFANSTSDIFHESLPDEAIDKIFAVMALCPQHTFQVLTKRAERMRDYFERMRFEAAGEDGAWAPRRLDAYACQYSQSPCAAGYMEDVAWPLKNVWLGVSCERQQEADERIPLLLQTPAAIRFISAEPLLGPIDLRAIRIDAKSAIDALDPLKPIPGPFHSGLDWVIVGGESGHGARQMELPWVRALRDQCAASGVPFFFKQWGGWVPGDGDCVGQQYYRVGKKAAGRLLDGREWNEFPGGAHA
jgi:protein gp37